MAYRIVMTVFFVVGFWYQLSWTVSSIRSKEKLVAWTFGAGGAVSIGLLVWTWLLGC